MGLIVASATMLFTRDFLEGNGWIPEAPKESVQEIDWMHGAWGRATAWPQGEENESTAQSESIPIEDVLSFLLRKQILIPKPREVRHYLLRYSDMTLLLAYVCDRAHRQFARRAELSVEVYHDPEISDAYLTLYVRQGKYDTNLIREIQKLRECYETLLVEKTGWLHVTTDFRPPHAVKT